MVAPHSTPHTASSSPLPLGKDWIQEHTHAHSHPKTKGHLKLLSLQVAFVSLNIKMMNLAVLLARAHEFPRKLRL